VSIWYSQELECQACGHAFATELAKGIHARRVPLVREQILRGELHHVRCPTCNAAVDAHREIAYTDFARHQWVHVATPAQLVDTAGVERSALELFDRHMVGGPPMIAAIAHSFRVRVVFDLDELREKLAIWDADLDDAIVECVKLRCLREQPSIAAPKRRIRLRAIASTELAMAAIDRDQPRVDVARWVVPRAIVDDVVRNRTEWEASMPELFGRGFVSLDRYL